MTTEAADRAPTFDPVAAMSLRIEAGDQLGALTLARELHPAQLADAFAGIDHEVSDLLVQRLAPRELGAALAYLEPHYREDLLVGLAPERIAQVMEVVADDVATDIVQDLPEEIGSQVLAALSLRQQHAISHLMAHDEESAGGRMTGQRIAMPPGRLAGEVIDDLRSIRPDATQPFYIYVTDDDGRLEGVVNLRSLLIAPAQTPIAELTLRDDVVSVNASTDQEEAARLLKRYKLLSLPVVDDDGHLIGALTADDLIDVLEDEATEDMFRQVGVHEDEDLRSIVRSVRFRLPWLMVNLVTVLLVGFVGALFESTVARVAVLAAFLPVVAGQGGNAGIQTLTGRDPLARRRPPARTRPLAGSAARGGNGVAQRPGGRRGGRAGRLALAGQRGARPDRRPGARRQHARRRHRRGADPDGPAALPLGPRPLGGDLAHHGHRRARLRCLPHPRRALRERDRLRAALRPRGGGSSS